VAAPFMSILVKSYFRVVTKQ